MFYDVNLICKQEEKNILTIRKVFPKKRKRNKKAGLERNYLATEKKEYITTEINIHVKNSGRFTAIMAVGRTVVIKLFKGDTLTIASNGEWKVSGPRRHD